MKNTKHTYVPEASTFKELLKCSSFRILTFISPFQAVFAFHSHSLHFKVIVAANWLFLCKMTSGGLFKTSTFLSFVRWFSF